MESPRVLRLRVSHVMPDERGVNIALARDVTADPVNNFFFALSPDERPPDPGTMLIVTIFEETQ